MPGWASPISDSFSNCPFQGDFSTFQQESGCKIILTRYHIECTMCHHAGAHVLFKFCIWQKFWVDTRHETEGKHPWLKLKLKTATQDSTKFENLTSMQCIDKAYWHVFDEMKTNKSFSPLICDFWLCRMQKGNYFLLGSCLFLVQFMSGTFWNGLNKFYCPRIRCQVTFLSRIGQMGSRRKYILFQ